MLYSCIEEIRNVQIQRRQERCQKETGKIYQGKEEGKAGEEVEIGQYPKEIIDSVHHAFMLVLAALRIQHRSVPPFADPMIQTELARSRRSIYALSNIFSFRWR